MEKMQAFNPFYPPSVPNDDACSTFIEAQV